MSIENLDNAKIKHTGTNGNGDSTNDLHNHECHHTHQLFALIVCLCGSYLPLPMPLFMHGGNMGT